MFKSHDYDIFSVLVRFIYTNKFRDNFYLWSYYMYMFSYSKNEIYDVHIHSLTSLNMILLITQPTLPLPLSLYDGYSLLFLPWLLWTPKWPSAHWSISSFRLLRLLPFLSFHVLPSSLTRETSSSSRFCFQESHSSSKIQSLALLWPFSFQRLLARNSNICHERLLYVPWKSIFGPPPLVWHFHRSNARYPEVP